MYSDDLIKFKHDITHNLQSRKKFKRRVSCNDLEKKKTHDILSLASSYDLKKYR